MVWERYCYASPKPEFFFIFFVYIFIRISANTNPFGLQFSQMILHTETSKLMYNWSFLFVQFCTSQHSYPVPLSTSWSESSFAGFWVRDGRLNDMTSQTPLRRRSLAWSCFRSQKNTPHALCTGSHHRASLIDRLQSFPTAVLRNLFASGWSARSLFSAFENFLISNMFYNQNFLLFSKNPLNQQFLTSTSTPYSIVHDPCVK